MIGRALIFVALVIGFVWIDTDLANINHTLAIIAGHLGAIATKP